MTTRNKKKYTNDIVLIAACVVAIIATWFTNKNTSALKTISNLPDLSAATNAQRVNFLNNYNIDCESEPCEIRDVVLPLEFSAAFLRYEALMKKQGLSLENYKGETVRKYSYKVKGKNAIAELLVHNGKIVACAVLSLSDDGSFFKIIT